MQQTNTADMLDLAVQYIKDLQEQVKVMFSHVTHYSLFNLLLSSFSKVGYLVRGWKRAGQDVDALVRETRSRSMRS